MRNLQRPQSLFVLLVFVVVAPGCQMMYRYRPLPVLVRDAETKQPIAEAKVHLSYPLTRDSLAPFDSSESTGAEGIARLRAVPYGDFGVHVEASAKGYLTAQQTISSESIQRLEPPHPFETTEQRKPELVVEMFAEPRFSVELIVPSGYRGQIKAEVQNQDEVPLSPGQRCFRYPVTDGFVRIKGPGVLRRVYPSDYRACYADGTPLSGEMSLTKVGFRWLRTQGETQYFLVGTQPEYDMQRRMAPDADPPSERRPASTRDGKRPERSHFHP
jgi:hypothetical protein